MSMVSEGKATAHAQRGIAVPTVNPPSYVRLMLIAAVAMAAVVTMWTLLFHQEVPPVNPFAETLEGVLGQPRQAIAAQSFSCSPSSGGYPQSSPEHTVAEQSGYCSRAPVAGPFSLIGAALSRGVVRQVEFSMRAGALTVGDLALLWGRPNVRIYRQSVNLEWPRIGISANGWAESWRFSYSIPVQRISFSPTA